MTGTTHYHPQPTRSGRIPVAPSEEEINALIAMDNYFEFPSESDSDDEDFVPPETVGAEDEETPQDGANGIGDFLPEDFDFEGFTTDGYLEDDWLKENWHSIRADLAKANAAEHGAWAHTNPSSAGDAREEDLDANKDDEGSSEADAEREERTSSSPSRSTPQTTALDPSLPRAQSSSRSQISSHPLVDTRLRPTDTSRPFPHLGADVSSYSSSPFDPQPSVPAIYHESHTSRSGHIQDGKTATVNTAGHPVSTIGHPPGSGRHVPTNASTSSTGREFFAVPASRSTSSKKTTKKNTVAGTSTTSDASQNVPTTAPPVSRRGRPRTELKPVSEPLSPESAEAERKRRKNVEQSRIHRERKRARIQASEEKLELLERENRALKEEILQLKSLLKEGSTTLPDGSHIDGVHQTIPKTETPAFNVDDIAKMMAAAIKSVLQPTQPVVLPPTSTPYVNSAAGAGPVQAPASSAPPPPAYHPHHPSQPPQHYHAQVQTEPAAFPPDSTSVSTMESSMAALLAMMSRQGGPATS